MRMLPRALLTALVLIGTPALAAPVKVVLLTPRMQREADRPNAGVVGELMVDALGKDGMTALGSGDVVPFLDETAQSQLEACDDDTACLIEIGGALGVDYIVAPSIGVLDESWVVTMRFLVPKDGTVAHRVTKQWPRTREFSETICPFVQETLAGLGKIDRRVTGDARRCGDTTAPLASTGPSAGKNGAPGEELEPLPAPKRAPGGVAFGLRAGTGGHSGILGIGAEVRTSSFAFGIGTGTYTLTASATWFPTQFGEIVAPYLSAHVAWTLADGLVKQKPGAAGGATVGLELRPVSWLNLRGGIGAAYNPQTYGTEGHPPLAVDGSLGFVF